VISNDALRSSGLYSDVYQPLSEYDLDVALAGTDTIPPPANPQDPSLLAHLLYEDEVHFIQTYTINVQQLPPERRNLMLMLLNLFIRNRRSARPYLEQMLSRRDMKRNNGERITKAEFLRFSGRVEGCP
jgi:hypothetical protein